MLEVSRASQRDLLIHGISEAEMHGSRAGSSGQLKLPLLDPPGLEAGSSRSPPMDFRIAKGHPAPLPLFIAHLLPDTFLLPKPGVVRGCEVPP